MTQATFATRAPHAAVRPLPVAAALLACALFAPLGLAATAPAHKPAPIYVHMNGANMFLENVVAVRPGQDVVFVNQDTGAHTIVGYNPLTGKSNPRFEGAVTGTPGPGHKVSTYAVDFNHAGLKFYYCSVHAELMQEPGGRTMPKKRPTVHGFGDPMAGLIIVTTDPHLLADNPPTTHEKILPGYFGG
ncbi:MAG: Cupredoxin [Betaproteobacteria bacterium]|nr:Cupredoxin [Betaproteobacteria bacterium]MDE2124377.1 Cupredoxin [Betaproteobacteria bacterium]MDE2186030.1 Cupredoxin [Betaproteobacteria bacterium]MDE2325507.1 Cupredoxin [Betaproteobacteria bacterium]